MVDLDSPLWASIPASPGPDSTLTVRLLCQAYAGDDSVYPELHHQVCHQCSVGANAYITVPHLVAIARNLPRKRRVWPLSIIGTVAAARVTNPKDAPPLQEEWRAEYLAANDEARALAADTLKEGGLTPTESQELIATLAALHGHVNLAMHVFLQGGVTELSCPICGESIDYVDRSG